MARAQAATYAKPERKVMSVWEALGMLGTLREYETALLQEEGTDADLPLVVHAMQTAENCRAAFPDLDWLHLVGLIHSLGKVLAHKQCVPALSHTWRSVLPSKAPDKSCTAGPCDEPWWMVGIDLHGAALQAVKRCLMWQLAQP